MSIHPQQKLSRHEHERGSQQWLDACLSHPQARFLPLRDSKPLIQEQPPALCWVERKDMEHQFGKGSAPILLGLDGDAPRFAMHLTQPRRFTAHSVRGRSFMGLREALGLLPAQDAALAAEAISVAFWNRRSRFCGECGAPMRMLEGGYRRSCGKCSSDAFPRLDPVAIMLVHNGSRCLLGRAANQPDPLRYTCLGGHNHPGEPIEETVRREVLEESGVEVDQVVYHSSQAWPFKYKLMLGFFARAITEEIRVEEHELADVRWFERAQVEAALKGGDSGLTLPPPHTIANRLISAWVSRR